VKRTSYGITDTTLLKCFLVVRDIQGSPKNWHTFLYALTSSNVD